MRILNVKLYEDFRQGNFKYLRYLIGDGNSERYRFRSHHSSPYGLLNLIITEVNLIYSIVFESADNPPSACLLSTRTGTRRSQWAPRKDMTSRSVVEVSRGVEVVQSCIFYCLGVVVYIRWTHLPGKTCSLCVGRYLFSVTLRFLVFIHSTRFNVCLVNDSIYIGQLTLSPFANKTIEIRKGMSGRFWSISLL